MPAFVAKDLHALGVRAALDLEQLAAFEPHEAWVRQVEGHGDSGYVGGREPLIRQPEMRAQPELSLLELGIELGRTVFEPGAGDGHPELLQPELQESLVGPAGPGMAAKARGSHPEGERRRPEHGARAVRWQGECPAATIRGAGDFAQPLCVAPAPELPAIHHRPVRLHRGDPDPGDGGRLADLRAHPQQAGAWADRPGRGAAVHQHGAVCRTRRRPARPAPHRADGAGGAPGLFGGAGGAAVPPSGRPAPGGARDLRRHRRQRIRAELPAARPAGTGRRTGAAAAVRERDHVAQRIVAARLGDRVPRSAASCSRSAARRSLTPWTPR